MSTPPTVEDCQNPSFWQRILPWLRLLRLPTVFTAVADIFCGYFLTRKLSIETLPQETSLWLLLGASAGLYLAGMVLNDVFDAKLDAEERPERPIPSGAIRLHHAQIFGGILMAAGLTCAVLAGIVPLQIAVLIAACVLLYDAFAKSTWAGPVVMGSCRGLNILLGASLAGDQFLSWNTSHVTAATGLLVYITGVTVFARNEAGEASTPSMRIGLAIATFGLLIDLWSINRFSVSDASRVAGCVVLALLAVNIILRGGRAIRVQQPRLTQKTVGLMLLCIIFIDAAMVLGITGNSPLAAVIAVLTIPAVLMKKVIPLS